MRKLASYKEYDKLSATTEDWLRSKAPLFASVYGEVHAALTEYLANQKELTIYPQFSDEKKQ
jgi:hypothetical protein